MEKESNTTSDLETMAGCDIVDSKDKLCLLDVKPLDPNLHITSSSQNEGHNASCVGSTARDLSTITVKLEIGNADGQRCNVVNHNGLGPSSLIPSYIGDSDEYKISTCNTSDSMTIDQHRPISPVRKTMFNENWIKNEPRSPADSFPTLNKDIIMINSEVDDMVSGNADLENDIAGKPLYSNNTPSMEIDCNRVEHEPTEVVLAEQQSRRYGPTREENQCSNEFSEKLIPDTSNPRLKRIFVCRICLKTYVLCSALKNHIIQKHPQCRDHCILVKNDNNDSDSDFQRQWFCPRKCKYLTSQYNALFEHLVTCQKPNLLSYHNRAGNAEIVDNLGDKGHAEDLMVHSQQTGQASSILGQTSEHEMKTVDQDLKDIATCKLCDLVFSTNLLLDGHMKDCHKEKHISTHSGEKPLKKCSHCNKILSTNSKLCLHMRIHTGEKPFKCTDCNKNFSQRNQLCRHMIIHTGEKPFKCTDCNKVFRRSTDLRSHMTKHTGEKPFKCTHCNKSFSRSCDLRLHMITHTGEKPFKCTHCIERFSQRYQLYVHIRTHTGEIPFKYNCTHCNKNFSQRSHLCVHMRIHTGEKPFKCTDCNKTFSRIDDLRVHMTKHTGEKPFKCTHCNKSFSRSCDLRLHMITHTGEKPFKCTHCTKRFSRRNQLYVHIRQHTGERPFKCTHCNKCFCGSEGLRCHMKTHTGEKPFKCTHCDKDFSRSRDFRVHMRTRTGERSFKCTLCNKIFCRSWDLRRHMRTHTHTGEKLFKAAGTHCNKGLNLDRNCRVHRRKHALEKTFKCTQCNKSFGRNGNLLLHMSMHTGENPFKCTHCNKDFICGRDFHAHMRIHTLERPFKCTHCNKCFCKNGNLLVHVWKAHTSKTI